MNPKLKIFQLLDTIDAIYWQPHRNPATYVDQERLERIETFKKSMLEHGFTEAETDELMREYLVNAGRWHQSDTQENPK